MLRSNVRENDGIKLGNKVAIWRDGSGWLYPARVTRVTRVSLKSFKMYG